jgi:hypothetical protein
VVAVAAVAARETVVVAAPERPPDPHPAVKTTVPAREIAASNRIFRMIDVVF